MPPNKKKKKPAANPARGFATVSVPSKPKSAESSTPSLTADSGLPSESDGPTPAEGSQPQTEGKPTQSLQDFSPEELERHLEESELQLFVEKYASKCKNDAVRQVSKLETERRILRQQSVTLSLLEWFPTEILNCILGLAETEENEVSPLTARDSNMTKRNAPEEELYAKLWTLKEALLKLGFPEQKIDDLFKYLLQYYPGNFVGLSRDALWNLDESLDWLAMHCSPDELPSYVRANTLALKESDKATSWINGKPRLITVIAIEC